MHRLSGLRQRTAEGPDGFAVRAFRVSPTATTRRPPESLNFASRVVANAPDSPVSNNHRGCEVAKGVRPSQPWVSLEPAAQVHCALRRVRTAEWRAAVTQPNRQHNEGPGRRTVRAPSFVAALDSPRRLGCRSIPQPAGSPRAGSSVPHPAAGRELLAERRHPSPRPCSWRSGPTRSSHRTTSGS